MSERFDVYVDYIYYSNSANCLSKEKQCCIPSLLDGLRIIDKLKGDGFKNNSLRQAYENEVAGLKAYGEELLASGMSEEQVARTLNQARRDLGIKYKSATPQPLRDYIYEINMTLQVHGKGLYSKGRRVGFNETM